MCDELPSTCIVWKMLSFQASRHSMVLLKTKTRSKNNKLQQTANFSRTKVWLWAVVTLLFLTELLIASVVIRF